MNPQTHKILTEIFVYGFSISGFFWWAWLFFMEVNGHKVYFHEPNIGIAAVELAVCLVILTILFSKLYLTAKVTNAKSI